MYCCNCGKKLGEGDLFCDNCGTPVSENISANLEKSEGEQEKTAADPEPGQKAEPAGGGAAFSDLEKKIMKNMEDELILEMPESVEPPVSWKKPEERTEEKPEGKQSKKKKKALIIALACATAVVAVCVIVFAVLLFSPENKLRKCVEDRDWTAASVLYEQSFKGSEKKAEKADEILRKAVDSLKEEFIAGTMDLATVKRHLKGIEGFWDNVYVEKALDFVKELGDSRAAFEEAERCMQKEEYEEAIRQYGKVISSDANYDTAKKNLETAKASYKEKVLGEADAYAELKNFDSAIAVVEDGLKVLAGDVELKSRLEELYRERDEYGIENILKEAEAYAAQNNCFEAMDTVRNGLLENPANDSLEAALKDYSEKYKQDVLEKAEAAIGTDENYEAAILVLDSALNTLDGEYAEIEQVIRERREEYVQKQLEKSQRENEESTIAGVWRGTEVSGEGFKMPLEQFLLTAEITDTTAVFICQPNGSFHMEVMGEIGDGTWTRDEAGIYYLNDGADTLPARIDASGRLQMEFDSVDLIFEKTGEA